MYKVKKFCIDCAHVFRLSSYFCQHPLAAHPVTGLIIDVYCNMARLEPNNIFFCGPEGKYWAEKETTLP